MEYKIEKVDGNMVITITMTEQEMVEIVLKGGLLPGTVGIGIGNGKSLDILEVEYSKLVNEEMWPRLRQKMGVNSQVQIAAKLGLSKTYLSQVLSGGRKPSKKMRQTMAQLMQDPEFEKLLNRITELEALIATKKRMQK